MQKGKPLPVCLLILGRFKERKELRLDVSFPYLMRFIFLVMTVLPALRR